MGYRPNPLATRLAKGKTHAIATILPLSSSHTFITPAFSQLLAGACDELSRYDYQLLVSSLPESVRELDLYQNYIDGGMADGLFVMRTQKQDARIQLLQERKFPVICHGSVDKNMPISTIDTDNYQAFYHITEHYLQQGLDKIALFDGPQPLTLSQQRCAGFMGAMHAYEQPMIQHWMQYLQLSEDAGYQAAHNILQEKERPQAILCANDTMAIGVISACKKVGLRVGQDIFVSGYGNYDQGRYCSPPLTTISYDAYAVGKMMASMMMAQLSNPDTEIQHKVVETQLIVRDS